MVFIEVAIACMILYLLFCLMYYIFRPSTSSKTSGANEANENKDKVSKLAVIFGSSMGSILINQMQIVSIILSKISWSPDLPLWLVDMLMFLSNLITFDISGIFASPDCVADIQPLDKWLFAFSLPIIFALLFVVWYGFVKIHFARNKKYDNIVAQTILHSVVNVLLIGLYTTVIKTCFQIFDCSDNKLDLDPRYPCNDPKVQMFQLIAGITFVTWGIIPFLILTVQLCRYRYRKGLEEHMKESDTFRIMYGWAIKKYRLDDRLVAFLWEIVNASTKVMMVAGSVLLFPENRAILHGVTIGVSMALHAWIRPYKDQMGNIMVVVFCGIDLIGIFSSPAESSPFVQGLFIVAILSTLLVVIYFALKSMREAFNIKRMQGLAGNKDKQLTPLERKLLCPLLFLFIWPLFKLISLTIRVAKIKKSKEKNDTKVVPVSKKKQLTKAGDSKTATEIKIATETKVRVRNWDLDLTDAQEVVGGNIKTPRKIFQQFDVDGDGSLDRTETHEALKQLGFYKMTDDEFDKMFQEFDKDKNGTINYKEFKTKLYVHILLVNCSTVLLCSFLTSYLFFLIFIVCFFNVLSFLFIYFPFDKKVYSHCFSSV